MSRSETYNVDCLEYMKTVSGGYFDLAIVDPPYGIGESGEKNHTRGKLAKATDYKGFEGGDTAPPSSEYFDELFRISKNQIIFGANHFISRMPRDSSCWIVWDKVNGKNDFADCELAWTSFPCAVRQFTYRWNGMLQADMKNKETRIHPTQKPVALYKWLLAKFAKSGDKIFDSHLGSGSSRIAAYDLGFDFFGCELSRYYYEAQERRFAEYVDQTRLF